jgi:hypothetical protein
MQICKKLPKLGGVPGDVIGRQATSSQLHSASLVRPRRGQAWRHGRTVPGAAPPERIPSAVRLPGASSHRGNRDGGRPRRGRVCACPDRFAMPTLPSRWSLRWPSGECRLGSSSAATRFREGGHHERSERHLAPTRVGDGCCDRRRCYVWWQSRPIVKADRAIVS